MTTLGKTLRVLGLLRSQGPPINTMVARNVSYQSGQANQNKRNGFGAAIAVASAAVAIKLYNDNDNRHSLLAESNPEEFSHENRVRMYMTLDKIFNYFASFQISTSKGQTPGRKSMMMTPLDFYAAITPDCTLVHGMGAGVHMEATDKEVEEGKFYMDKSPLSKSVLNDIGAQGLLSYSDFCFLLTLLSTPPRYTETAFNLFDVTGDGNIEAKEFAYVSTKMAHKAGGFGSYTQLDQEEILASNSGLMNYLFGKDRSKSLTKESFKQLQSDLLEEMIELEFREYDKDNSGRISEADLCKFLLKNTKIPPKKKAAMLKRVEKLWPAKARGISLPSFKNLFYVLAGGAELERALFYLDVEGIGVDMAEFRSISSWVSQKELSDHVARVLYALLDEDGDGRFFKEEIGPVLFDWRQSRGFDKGSLHVTMGQLRI